MKTKLTFLLALTFLFLFSGSSVVFGADFYSYIEQEDGTYTYRVPYDNGNVSHEITYKNGKRHGPTTGWDEETGTKDYETHYKNGKRHGQTTGWYETSEKRSETHYKNS